MTSKEIREGFINAFGSVRSELLQEIAYQLALANEREAARDEKKQKPYNMMYNDGWNNALECLKCTVDFTRELPIDVVTRVVGKIKRPIDPSGSNR